HSETTLGLEYGTLVPMRYMNGDQHFKVVSVSGWCAWHDLAESEKFGLAVRKAIEERYDGTVAVFASGSLSHHFANNGTAPEYMHKVFDPFLEAVDHSVVDMWKNGDWGTFLDMLPMYNDKCWGEGGMHDTAMLLGLLGGRDYDQGVEIITPYFGSSGTGQINAIFPVTPLKATACGHAMPHLTLEYSANLQDEGGLGPLCTKLARCLAGWQADGKAVYPIGGIRVRALCTQDYCIGD